MPQIDVSELMTDPDFVEPVTLITRLPKVDQYGQGYFESSALETVGSVQPASNRVVQKLPEAMRVANVQSFWIKAVIVASAPGKYASTIVYRGQTYQVQTVADWSAFGEGYTEGTCVAQEPA